MGDDMASDWDEWFFGDVDPTSPADLALMAVAPGVQVGRATASLASGWWDWFFSNSPSAAPQNGANWQDSSDFTRRCRVLIHGRAATDGSLPAEVFASFAEIERVYNQAASFNGFWRWLENRVQNEEPIYSAFGEGYYVPAQTISDDIWDLVSFYETGVGPPLQPARKIGTPAAPSVTAPSARTRRPTHR